MTKYPVARADEITRNGGKAVEVDGKRIGLFLVEGQVRAYEDFCPHAGAPLSGGRIRQEGERVVVRCPWHGWEFDLRTGAHMANPRCKLDAYRVEVEAGVVFVWV